VGSAANLTGAFCSIAFTSMRKRSSSTTRSHSKRCGPARSRVRACHRQADRSFHEIQAGAGIPLPDGAVFEEFAGLLRSDQTYVDGLSQSDPAWHIRGNDRVPQVLAVYNWPPNTDRYRRVARFVEYFFNRFDQSKSRRSIQMAGINLASSLFRLDQVSSCRESLAGCSCSEHATRTWSSRKAKRPD